jgi:3-dehydroquinate dehydratase-2
MRILSKQPIVLVLNGPNLNMLGTREPEVYGRDTLDDIAKACAGRGKELGLTVDFRQSNHEGELITWLQQARATGSSGTVGIVINPAGLSHTSVALMDAVQLTDLPVIEVHLQHLPPRDLPPSFLHQPPPKASSAALAPRATCWRSMPWRPCETQENQPKKVRSEQIRRR